MPPKKKNANSAVIFSANSPRKKDEKMLRHAQNGDWDKVQESLNAGANIKFICRDTGHNLIHFAARDGRVDFVKTAKECGIDINLTSFYNTDSWCPIHFAAESQGPDVIRELVKLGARPDIKTNGNYQQMTPAEIAHFEANYDTEVMLQKLAENKSTMKAKI